MSEDKIMEVSAGMSGITGIVSGIATFTIANSMVGDPWKAATTAVITGALSAIYAGYKIFKYALKCDVDNSSRTFSIKDLKELKKEEQLEILKSMSKITEYTAQALDQVHKGEQNQAQLLESQTKCLSNL